MLGPLQVERDGARVELGAAKQRAVLAILLLNADRVVPGDDLMEQLWAEAPPANAKTALQGYVSALRKLLGRDAIETAAGGYALRCEPDQVDLRRFEQAFSAAHALLAAGDAATAAAGY